MLAQLLFQKQQQRWQLGDTVIIDSKWQFTITNFAEDGDTTDLGIYHDGTGACLWVSNQHSELFQQKLDQIIKWEYANNYSAYLRSQVLNRVYPVIGQAIHVQAGVA